MSLNHSIHTLWHLKNTWTEVAAWLLLLALSYAFVILNAIQAHQIAKLLSCPGTGREVCAVEKVMAKGLATILSCLPELILESLGNIASAISAKIHLWLISSFVQLPMEQIIANLNLY